MIGSQGLQPVSAQALFTDRLFRVPAYQRAYAWEQKQWDDLWEDIHEGIATETTHFLGTVVLMANGTVRGRTGRNLMEYHLVDGQQRVTTLCLLLLAVYGHVRHDHSDIAEGLWGDFIEHEQNRTYLSLGPLNGQYFPKLVEALRQGQQLPTDPDKRSTNALLRQAVYRFHDLVNEWLPVEGKSEELLRLNDYVRKDLQVLCHVTDDKRLAIKTFQTVNDRGKELSLLEKTKSFLMFYLTRYLPDDAEVVGIVEEKFGQVFDDFDAAKDLAGEFDVDYLKNPHQFNEDEFLVYAYHYGASSSKSRFDLGCGIEYDITPRRVFEEFVKDSCQALRERRAVLREFVVDWCKDLQAVSRALVSLLSRIPDQPSYRRLFRFQRPSAIVYPLLVTAEARGFLDEEMINAVAVLDLRVYKVRGLGTGTGPRAELYRRAVFEMKTGDRNEIFQNIVSFCGYFGCDRELESNLRGPVYGHPWVKYLLWQYAMDAESEVDELDYELYADCQVDHILPDDSSLFDVKAIGFEDDDNYRETKGGFGNLTVLEGGLNNRAKNSPPRSKGRVYGDSRLQSNRRLGIRMQEGFTRESQTERMNDYVEFFKRKWPIPTDYV